MISTIQPTPRRTHQHMRTVQSVPTSTGAGRAQWPRLRETEEIQRRLHRQPRRKAQGRPPQQAQGRPHSLKEVVP